MNKEKLWQLRNEVKINGNCKDDFKNSFGIDEKELYYFFGAYIEDLMFIFENNTKKEKLEKLSDKQYWQKVFKYDTKNNLWDFYSSLDKNGF